MPLRRRTDVMTIHHPHVCVCVCVCAVYDKRNCIPVAAPGDKCYLLAEHAPDFYKNGVTVPLVNFGFPMFSFL